MSNKKGERQCPWEQTIQPAVLHGAVPAPQTQVHRGRNPEFNPFYLAEMYPSASSLLSTAMLPLEKIKDDCFVVLDTSVLLALYELSGKGLAEVQKKLRQLADSKRLFVPAQVIREFVKNRPERLQALYKRLNPPYRALESLPRYAVFDACPEFAEAAKQRDELSKRCHEYNKLRTNYHATLSDVLKKVHDRGWEDPVTTLCRDLFVSTAICETSTSRGDLIADLKRRNAHDIAPGCYDADQPEGGLGDLLIWHAILDLGRQNKRNLLFVTNDKKVDWWHRDGDRLICPAFNLVEEFYRLSGQKTFQLARFDTFLEVYGLPQVVPEVRAAEQGDLAGPALVRESTFSSVEASVRGWLTDNGFTILQTSGADFFALDQSRTAYDVSAIIIREVQDAGDAILKACGRRRQGKFMVVAVFPSQEDAEQAVLAVRDVASSAEDIRIICGSIAAPGCFEKTVEFSIGKRD